MCVLLIISLLQGTNDRSTHMTMSVPAASATSQISRFMKQAKRSEHDHTVCMVVLALRVLVVRSLNIHALGEEQTVMCKQPPPPPGIMCVQAWIMHGPQCHIALPGLWGVRMATPEYMPFVVAFRYIQTWGLITSELSMLHD